MPTYKEIVQKISELQRQADELRASEQATVIAEIKQKIVEYGLSADDLGFGAKGGPASKKPAAKCRCVIATAKATPGPAAANARAGWSRSCRPARRWKIFLLPEA